jgi:hypothetical protein
LARFRSLRLCYFFLCSLCPFRCLCFAESSPFSSLLLAAQFLRLAVP